MNMRVKRIEKALAIDNDISKLLFEDEPEWLLAFGWVANIEHLECAVLECCPSFDHIARDLGTMEVRNIN